MSWVKTTFKTYCDKQGYILLAEDLRYIEKSLQSIPSHLQRPVLFEYCKQWQRAVDSEKNISRKQSMGRRAANLYLLEQSKQ